MTSTSDTKQIERIKQFTESKIAEMECELKILEFSKQKTVENLKREILSSKAGLEI